MKLKHFIPMAVASAALILCPGCNRSEVERTADEVEDTTEEIVEETGDAVEEAGDELEDATN